MMLPFAGLSANRPPPTVGLKRIAPPPMPLALSAGCVGGHRFRPYVRERGIDTRAVECRAPLHAAKCAAFADRGLPQNLAAAIWIDSVHHT
jgi:hypothetical protein